MPKDYYLLFTAERPRKLNNFPRLTLTVGEQAPELAMHAAVSVAAGRRRRERVVGPLLQWWGSFGTRAAAGSH